MRRQAATVSVLGNEALFPLRHQLRPPERLIGRCYLTRQKQAPRILLLLPLRMIPNPPEESLLLPNQLHFPVLLLPRLYPDLLLILLRLTVKTKRTRTKELPLWVHLVLPKHLLTPRCSAYSRKRMSWILPPAPEPELYLQPYLLPLQGQEAIHEMNLQKPCTCNLVRRCDLHPTAYSTKVCHLALLTPAHWKVLPDLPAAFLLLPQRMCEMA